MEGDPFVLIEGMTIAGLATGATRGYIYLRWEYPDAHAALKAAIRAAYAAHYLGEDILGSGKTLRPRSAPGRRRLYLRRGDLAARVAGGQARPGAIQAAAAGASQGLFGKPTVINNVITFASVPIILDRGAEYYQHFGMGRSRGTLPMQLAGNIKHGGLIEKAFGMTLARAARTTTAAAA